MLTNPRLGRAVTLARSRRDAHSPFLSPPILSHIALDSSSDRLFASGEEFAFPTRWDLERAMPEVEVGAELVRTGNLVVYDAKSTKQPSKPWRQIGTDAGTLGTMARCAVAVDGERNSRFCARCGTPRVGPFGGPGGVECKTCGLERYRRTNPCAITLVHDPWRNAVLLGRNVAWKTARRYSLLAGYCEAFESVEHCAAREVLEESGIVIDGKSVDIVASQPWPFPILNNDGISLMFGCFATVASQGQIPKPDPKEMLDAQWFTAKEIRQELAANPNFLPFKASTARFLLDTYLDSEEQ